MTGLDRPLEKMAMRLAKSGLLLFIAGLVLGALIPAFASPRLALSAHSTAVQTGTALIVFGLLWPHTGLRPRASMILSNAIWMSTYALVTGLSLAAIFGATRLEPIASGGRVGEAWQETILAILVPGGSLVLLVACVVWLLLWRSRSAD